MTQAPMLIKSKEHKEATKKKKSITQRPWIDLGPQPKGRVKVIPGGAGSRTNFFEIWYNNSEWVLKYI